MADAIQGLRDGLKQVLREQHDTMRSLIEALEADALNWAPGAEMNSIAVLYTHLLGAEESLIATGIGESVERDRDAEFQARVLDGDALLRRIAEVEERTAGWIDRLSAEDLSTMREREGDRLNRRFIGSWWILHAIEHNREHIGQAMLTRQLYEQQG